jgi:hypothetical protein
MVPLDEPRPYLARTYFLPSVEVVQQYRAITGKVVYVARNPRTLISDMVRGSRVKLEERAQRAKKVIASPDEMHRSDEGHGNWQLHAREWTSPERVRAHFPHLEDVFVMRYEDLEGDPGGALHQIIDFLGVPGEVDGDRIRRTLQNWTPEKVREAGLKEVPPGMRAFRMPRPVLDVPEPDPSSLVDVEEELEAAYQERIFQDAEFAALVKQFGYAD